MATVKLAIHVVPDSSPETIGDMIRVLDNDRNTAFPTAKELVEALREVGVTSNEWVPATASELGILQRSSEGLELSAVGHAIGQAREDVRGELLHFLFYTGWHQAAPARFLQAWAYRLCCDRYWTADQVTLNGYFLDQQVEETINMAQQTFPALGLSNVEGIAFSRKSLTGVHRWLGGLRPPVLTEANDKQFARRTFCSPELLLLALGELLSADVEAVNIEVLLTREKRETLCKVCLLAPEYLDRALDWAIPTFPALIESGTSAGFYGRFIRLRKLPTVLDVIR